MSLTSPNLRAQGPRLLLVAVAYFVLGRFGMSMPYKLSVVTLLWLPLGLAVAAVFRWGRSMLMPVYAADVAVALWQHEPWGVALALGAANVLSVAAIVALLNWFRFNPFYWKRSDVISWCAASASGTLVGAAIGPGILWAAGAIDWTTLPQAALLWWLGDLVGLLLAGPVVLSLRQTALAQLRRLFPEFVALAALTGIIVWFAFFRRWPAQFALFHPMLLVMPLLVWSALRFGVLVASSLAMVVSLLAALATVNGAGSFAGSDAGVAVFSLWAFAGMLAVLSLLITALEAERNDGEATLRRERRELLILTDNLPDEILRLDHHQRLSFANRAVEIVHGLEGQFLVGLTLEDAGLPYASFPAWREAVQRVWSTAQGEIIELGFTGRNGPRRGVAQMVPETDETGAVRSVLILVRDTTEQHTLEAQLRQSQKLEAVGVLAGGVAHDFNNILTGIFGNTQMAMMELPKEHATQVFLQRVLQASNRAKAVVNQMLAFSRRQDQKMSAIALRTVIHEVLQLLRASIPSTIKISTKLPDAEQPVLGDSNQLHQVLINLVTNAAHAIGGAEGQINLFLDQCEVDAEAVRLQPQLRIGSYMRLGVSDTGRGMAAETLARIFEPFFTTKERGTGTGLGLAVVHGIVEQHGGSIVVYSEPGKGTTFLVYLPLYEPTVTAAQETGPAPGAETPRPPFRHGRGERIMVVDDEEIVLRVAQGVLLRIGYAPTSFSDPIEALRVFQENPQGYDMVLTDLTMPRLKGTELARKLREIRQDLPILLCTGFQGALVKSEITALRLGEPLLKPFTVDSLAHAVEKTLAAFRAGPDA